MRLAGHTYTFRELPLEAALENLAAVGFRDVELWLGHVPGRPAGAANGVDRLGLRACAVSAGGFFTDGANAPKRAFELADAVGASVVVMCAAPGLIPELDRIRPRNMTVAVENHWDQPLARSREVVAAIRTSDLRACLDTGHALAAGERPESFARGLGDLLAHVHLKEGRMATPFERLVGRRARVRALRRPGPVMPGAGSLDVTALLSALAAGGYGGFVSIEHEGERPVEALEALAVEWRRALGPHAASLSGARSASALQSPASVRAPVS